MGRRYFLEEFVMCTLPARNLLAAGAVLGTACHLPADDEPLAHALLVSDPRSEAR